MTIDFSTDRWNAVKNNARDWWSGTLGRPLIQVRLRGREPGRKASALPFYPFASYYSPQDSIADIVDAWDYELCQYHFMGDAFPEMIPNFGPGSIAAYMGSELENGDDTVWFHPFEGEDLAQITFDYQPDNYWLNRNRELIKTAQQRWGDQVQLGMTDLGGNMDILATFRNSEKLMFDLYDCPDLVKALNWRAHDLWWRYFDEFNALTQPVNPGYSTWARIFSEDPHYILQCDFCFMTSGAMFEEFVKPELEKTAQKLTNVFYHLDGPGQLTHLDSLLAIDSIQGIQWVPGAGQPDAAQWPEVYKKITDAGKKIHIAANMADNPLTVLDTIADQVGRADHIVFHLDGDLTMADQAEKLLQRFHCI